MECLALNPRYILQIFVKEYYCRLGLLPDCPLTTVYVLFPPHGQATDEETDPCSCCGVWWLFCGCSVNEGCKVLPKFVKLADVMEMQGRTQEWLNLSQIIVHSSPPPIQSSVITIVNDSFYGVAAGVRWMIRATSTTVCSCVRCRRSHARPRIRPCSSFADTSSPRAPSSNFPSAPTHTGLPPLTPPCAT